MLVSILLTMLGHFDQIKLGATCLTSQASLLGCVTSWMLLILLRVIILKKLLRKLWPPCGSTVKHIALVVNMLLLCFVFLLFSKFIFIFNIGNQNLEAEERLPIWYILDEFGYVTFYFDLCSSSFLYFRVVC